MCVCADTHTHTYTHTHLSVRRNPGFSKWQLRGWGQRGYMTSFRNSLASYLCSVLLLSTLLDILLCRWLERKLLKYLWLTFLEIVTT